MTRDKPETCRIASPRDLFIVAVELPPLKEKNLPEAIRFRLRSLYPGNLNDSRIDWHGTKPGGKRGARQIVYCATNDKLANMKEGGALILSPLKILMSLPQKGSEEKRMLIADDWGIEATFRNGDLISFTPLRGHKRPDADASEMPITIIHERGGQGVLPLSDILHGKPKDAFAIFTRTNEQTRKFSIKIVALGFLFLLAAGLYPVLLGVTTAAEKKRDALKLEYEETKREALRGQELLTAIQNIEGSQIITEGMAPHPYEILASLSDSLGSGWLNTLSLRESYLQFEAEGTDSIRTANSLRQSPLFKNMNLRQATPSKTFAEIFSVSGEISNDRQ